jgi:hypothetical protein
MLSSQNLRQCFKVSSCSHPRRLEMSTIPDPASTHSFMPLVFAAGDWRPTAAERPRSTNAVSISCVHGHLGYSQPETRAARGCRTYPPSSALISHFIYRVVIRLGQETCTKQAAIHAAATGCQHARFSTTKSGGLTLAIYQPMETTSKQSRETHTVLHQAAFRIARGTHFFWSPSAQWIHRRSWFHSPRSMLPESSRR